MHPAQKLCFCVTMALAPSLVMAEPIGTIKKLSGDVSIIRDSKTLPAALGSRVHQNDLISTSSEGHIGLLFDDDSRIAVGPGSKLSLNHYVFDPKSHEGEMSLKVDRGTVSVIAGKMSEKNSESISIEPPATSMTVSGNAFSIRVDNSTKEGTAR